MHYSPSVGDKIWKDGLPGKVLERRRARIRVEVLVCKAPRRRERMWTWADCLKKRGD